MFGFNSSVKRGFSRINVKEFETMRAGADAPFLLDVREPFEQTAFGKIPGVVNVPLGQLRQRGSELPANREQPIVAICQSGARSQQAAKMLADMGYSNVYSLDGGTMGWMNARR